MNCITCHHLSMRDTPPEYLTLGLAKCGCGDFQHEYWNFEADHQCGKHAQADDEIVSQRIQWNERRKAG